MKINTFYQKKVILNTMKNHITIYFTTFNNLIKNNN